MCRDGLEQTLNRIMPQSTYSEERKMFCLLGGAKLLAEAFSWLAAMWRTFNRRCVSARNADGRADAT